MSLDTIQLPSFIIQELFKNSLVELNNHQTNNQTSLESPLTFLGNNKKHILILVENEENLYLPEEQFNFLTGILSACKLSMEDIALLNIKKNKGIDHKKINSTLNPAFILLFGLKAEDIDLPLSVPYYQIQSYNGQTYLFSPSLPELENNRTEKMKLWESLKKQFSI